MDPSPPSPTPSLNATQEPKIAEAAKGRSAFVLLSQQLEHNNSGYLNSA